MSDLGNLQQEKDRQTAIQQAAEELSSRFRALAEALASNAQTCRVPFGPGRIGQFFRRQSPEGYVLDKGRLKVLLPDGRLWSYSRNEAARFPDGRVFDARVDSHEFTGTHSFPGGREFVFLGAVVESYSFGWAPASDLDPEDAAGLHAIYSDGRAVQWATADEAFAAIAESAVAANS